MRSWKFPQMFSGNNADIWKSTEYKEASTQNAKLLLGSFRGETLGDPYIGIAKLTFEQNSQILEDALIDTIYTQIALFLPQVRVQRSDIKIDRSSYPGKVICSFYGVNQIDFTVNTYSIVLFEQSDLSA